MWHKSKSNTAKFGQSVRNKTRSIVPLVSIIVPCFNSGLALKNAINSCKLQTYPRIETIVVNDGSNDLITLKVLKSLTRSGTQVINLERNSGLPVARNTGFDAAKGEYVVFLDSDDWFEETAIEIMINASIGMEGKCFIYSDVIFEGEKNGISCRPYNAFSHLALNNFPYSIMIQKESIDWSPLYDEDLKFGLEDWNLNLKLIEKRFQPVRLNKPIFHYNINSSGMLESITKHNFFSIWKIIQKKRKTLYSRQMMWKLFKLQTLRNRNFQVIIPLILILLSKLPFNGFLDKLFFKINRILNFSRRLP